MYVKTQGNFHAPCAYKEAFLEKYQFMLFYELTLDYSFLEGEFVLKDRDYGEGIALKYHNYEFDEPITEEVPDWEQFCIEGTLRPRN